MCWHSHSFGTNGLFLSQAVSQWSLVLATFLQRIYDISTLQSLGSGVLFSLFFLFLFSVELSDFDFVFECRSLLEGDSPSFLVWDDFDLHDFPFLCTEGVGGADIEFVLTKVGENAESISDVSHADSDAVGTWADAFVEDRKAFFVVEAAIFVAAAVDGAAVNRVGSALQIKGAAHAVVVNQAQLGG